MSEQEREGESASDQVEPHGHRVPRSDEPTEPGIATEREADEDDDDGEGSKVP